MADRAQRFGDVLHQGADVGALGTAHLELDLGLAIRSSSMRSIRIWRGCAFDRLAPARQFIQPLPCMLQRRIHRRNLLSAHPESERSTALTGLRIERRNRQRRNDAAIRIGRIGLLAQPGDHPIGLAASRAAVRTPWWPDRSTPAAGRSPADRGCLHVRPSARETNRARLLQGRVARHARAACRATGCHRPRGRSAAGGVRDAVDAFMRLCLRAARIVGGSSGIVDMPALHRPSPHSMISADKCAPFSISSSGTKRISGACRSASERPSGPRSNPAASSRISCVGSGSLSPPMTE